MFSDHLQKVDKVPYKTLLVVAAGLVFLCQLVAMVLVVDSQVEKAEIRDAHYSSAQMVIADCSENYSGSARSRCIEQMQLELASSSAGDGEADARGVTRLEAQRPAPLVSRVKGIIQAAFATRQ